MIICLSANSSWYLYNFRNDLIRRLIADGHKVITVAPDDKYSSHLKNFGCSFFSVFLDSKGINPINESRSLFKYLNLYRVVRPDVTLHFTIKPIIYGTLASKWLGIPSINTITGLGTGFLSGRTMEFLSKTLLKIALHQS